MDDKSEGNSPNPLHDDILDDVKDRSKWATYDEEVMKRRLAERKSKRVKPYPGAPNGVVPIIDDVTTEKTDQEITMLMNAPRMAIFFPLEVWPPGLLEKAEMAFDTYLRHMVEIRPKLEEAVDTKNCRGFSVVKVLRTEHDRFGEIPDVDARDPRDVIVPSNTKNIRDAERIVDVLRFTKRELRGKAKKGWNNKTIEELIKAAKADAGDQTSSEKSSLKATEHLIGLTTSGKNTETVVVWECWTYATEKLVELCKNADIEVGRRCCILYGPDKPDAILHSYPWKEKDIIEPLTQQEVLVETALAITEGRSPELFRTISGKDRAWPFIQPRAEYRTRYYYDSRGIGIKCGDDQIYATGIFNAKMTWMDYVSNPMFRNSGEFDNSSNFTAEPGSIMPRGLDYANTPNIPPALDFSLDYHKREAGRRSGAASQYNYSEGISESRKVQKTKAEVDYEAARVNLVSSASVDRFNDPWRETFQQLWEDLARMQKPIPMLRNGKFEGIAPFDIYKFKCLLVPAASAKTMNPDLQFQKDAMVMDYAAKYLQMVPQDIEKGLRKVIGRVDPIMADDLIISGQQKGPQGQQPVYTTLNDIQSALKGIGDALNQLATLTDKNDVEIRDLQKLTLKHDDKLQPKGAILGPQVA